jgi:hypothetical protein
VSRSVLVAVVDEDAGAAAHGPASDGRRAREVPQACARRREGKGLRTTRNARSGHVHSWSRCGSATEPEECSPQRSDGVPREAKSSASPRRHGGRALEALRLPLEVSLSFAAKHAERLIHLGSEPRRQRLTDTQIPAKRRFASPVPRGVLKMPQISTSGRPERYSVSPGGRDARRARARSIADAATRLGTGRSKQRLAADHAAPSTADEGHTER